MALNSFLFLLVFLPAVLIVQILLQKYAGRRWPEAWLLASSLVFYAFAGWSEAPLLLGSVILNWWIGRMMVSGSGEVKCKWVLQIGLAANIAFLCFIKYANFLLSLVAALHGPRDRALLTGVFRWG